jgi:DNA-binding XRE family transcriptional regulator
VAKLTKADAARQLGIARSTLYKLIDQGKVSPSPEGLIDQAELIRVAAYVDTLKERTRASADTSEIPAQRHAETPHGRPQTDGRGQSWTDTSERPQTSSDALVDILREQIQILREELQEAR